MDANINVTKSTLDVIEHNTLPVLYNITSSTIIYRRSIKIIDRA